MTKRIALIGSSMVCLAIMGAFLGYTKSHSKGLSPIQLENIEALANDDESTAWGSKCFNKYTESSWGLVIKNRACSPCGTIKYVTSCTYASNC